MNVTLLQLINLFLQVSVATHPCSQCVEMNSARPQFQPAMCCIVRSKFKLDDADGSAACAVCYAMGKFQCSSRAVVRRNSIDSKIAPRIRNMSSNSQGENFLTRNASTRTGSCDIRRPSRESCEFINSEDYIHGDLSVPELMMKKSKFAGKSPAVLSTGDELHENETIQFNRGNGIGLRRSLTDSSTRRRARFIDESGLGDQFEALEHLTNQVEGLQKNFKVANEKIEHLESILETHTSTLKGIEQKSQEQSTMIGKLQANNTDQTSSNFHLARLIEVVDDLQRCITSQKVDIQALKQGSPLLPPKTDLVPRTAEPLSEASQTLDDLRRFIDETEDKQRQRKALYLDHLNRELQRTMRSNSMSRRSGFVPRPLDI